MDAPSPTTHASNQEPTSQLKSNLIAVVTSVSEIRITITEYPNHDGPKTAPVDPVVVVVPAGTLTVIAQEIVTETRVVAVPC